MARAPTVVAGRELVPDHDSGELAGVERLGSRAVDTRSLASRSSAASTPAMVNTNALLPIPTGSRPVSTLRMQRRQCRSAR